MYVSPFVYAKLPRCTSTNNEIWLSGLVDRWMTCVDSRKLSVSDSSPLSLSPRSSMFSRRLWQLASVNTSRDRTSSFNVQKIINNGLI